MSAAVTAGVDPNARSLAGLAHPESPDEYPIMQTIAQGLCLRLEELKPDEVADLIAEFKHQGTDIAPRGEVTVCDIFREDERRRVAEIVSGTSNALPADREEERQRAVIRIQEILCGK